MKLSTLEIPSRPARPIASARGSARELVPIAALTTTVLALHLSQIDQSVIGDELFTFHDVVRHSFSSVLRGIHQGGENSPPLFFLLAWVSAKLGDPTVWIRLPSILLGAATIPLVYAIGRDTVGWRAGLGGAVVLAFSPFSLYYGVEARPYATAAFFVALSTLALLRAVRTRSPRWWMLYAIATTAAAYSHYTSVFVLGVQAAWSLWACREHLREPVIANALVVLLYLPWLPNVRGKSLHVISQLEKLTASNVFGDLARVIPGYPYAGLRAIPTVPGLAAVGACVAIGLVWLAWDRREVATEAAKLRSPRYLVLLCALAAASPVGLLLYSLLGTDIWLARGLYASLPAAALLLGSLLTRLPAPLAAVTVTVFLATLLVGTVRAVSPRYARGPFRAVAGYLDGAAGSRDPIVVYSIPGAPAISAQLKKPHLRVNSAAEALASTVHSDQHLFVVVDALFARGFHIVGAPTMDGFRPIADKHFVGLFPTDVWTYRRTR